MKTSKNFAARKINLIIKETISNDKKGNMEINFRSAENNVSFLRKQLLGFRQIKSSLKKQFCARRSLILLCQLELLKNEFILVTMVTKTEIIPINLVPAWLTNYLQVNLS